MDGLKAALAWTVKFNTSSKKVLSSARSVKREGIKISSTRVMMWFVVGELEARDNFEESPSYSTYYDA